MCLVNKPKTPGQIPVSADMTADALKIGAKPVGGAPTTAKDNLKVQSK